LWIARTSGTQRAIANRDDPGILALPSSFKPFMLQSIRSCYDQPGSGAAVKRGGGQRRLRWVRRFPSRKKIPLRNRSPIRTVPSQNRGRSLKMWAAASLLIDTSRSPFALDLLMVRSAATLGLALGCVLTAATAVASDFEIRVSAKSDGRETQTERTNESPSQNRTPPRPVMEVDRNAHVLLSWHAENRGKSDTFEDVLVHFFVVEETKTGQIQVPKLSAGVVYEGAITMDFRPRDKADWRMTLKIPDAGSYLVRVETIGMAPKHGHEHFAAMDLVVK